MARDAVYLGIDIGTTQTKVAALAADGRRAVAREATPTADDGAGPVHEPAALLAVVQELALRAVTRLGGGRVRAACVASVGEEGIALDARGRPLYPALAWYGRRDSDAGDRFRRSHDALDTYRRCGLPQDPIHSLFQWAWLRDHRPDVLDRMCTWLSVSEWVAFALGGRPAFSPSQASRTHLWAPYAQAWQGDWAAFLGVDASVLPAVVPSGAVLGALRPQALPGLCVAADAVVVMGGQDHPVGAWAAGARSEAVALNSLGTAEVVQVANPTGRPPTVDGFRAGLHHGATVAPSAEVGQYVMAPLHTGAALAAIARLLGQPLAALERMAAAAPAGARGMRYAPPPWHADPRASFTAVPLDADAGVWMRAVLEGWARRAAAALGEAQREAGVRVSEVRAIGGGTGGALALTIRASMLACPLYVVDEPELVAWGAAALAIGAVEPAAAPPAPPARLVEAVPAWREIYATGADGA